MNKLTKLTIKKFRNVIPTTLEFRPGLNVVLGKNAAGKTTFLRLLSTVLGVREEALKDDVLAVSYQYRSEGVHNRGHPLDIEHTIVRTRGNELLLPRAPRRSIVEELSRVEELSSSPQTDYFVVERHGRLLLKAEVLPNEVIIEKEGRRGRIPVNSGSGPLFSMVLACAQVTVDEPLAERFLDQLLSSEVMSAGRMDESLERFDALLGIMSEESTSRMQWTPRRIPSSMYGIGPFLPEATSASFSLAFLDRVARVLGYDSASARFDIERFSPEPGKHVELLRNLRFFFKRSGEEISHELLSYGQKRLLSFFAHADASSDVIIVDELVNGLHHEWISACLNEIGERQAFLTSQNPLLLDFLRFESAEEVRRTFILCERENRENGAQLIWRNPTEEEAESFFSAYQTGIQRVSDILLTKGLW